MRTRLLVVNKCHSHKEKTGNTELITIIIIIIIIIMIECLFRTTLKNIPSVAKYGKTRNNTRTNDNSLKIF